MEYIYNHFYFIKFFCSSFAWREWITECLKVKAAWSFWKDDIQFKHQIHTKYKGCICPPLSQIHFWQCHFWRSVKVCAPHRRYGPWCSRLSGQMGETNTDMFNYAFYSKLLKSFTVYTCKHLSSCPPASSLANPSVSFCHEKTERESKRELERLVLCFYNTLDLLKWSFKVLVPCVRCLWGLRSAAHPGVFD